MTTTPDESVRDLVGYEARLHKMRFNDLISEAHRVGAFEAESDPEFTWTRSVLIERILAIQGIDPEVLATPEGPVILPPRPEPEPETAIVITVPGTGDPWPTQVLVRLPGHIAPDAIAVDFRPEPQASWQPSDFFGNAVAVNHQ